MAIHHDYSGGIPAANVAAFTRELFEATERAKSEQGKARNVRKRMEDAGIDLKAFDLAKKLCILDPTDAVGRLNKAYYYLKAMHAPVGAQLNFIELVTDNSLSDEQRQQKWYDDGYHAGLSGKWEKDCPNGVHLPAGQKWLEGYRDAQAELAKKYVDEETKPPDAEEVFTANQADQSSPAPRRRGRPPGSGKKAKVDVPTPMRSEAEVPLVAAAEPSADIGPMAPAPPDPDEEIAFSDDDAPPFDEPPAPPEPVGLLN